MAILFPLQQAFDAIPDLIICDVMIPGKNGFELTNVFKSDIRTSHIPIILLTAKTEIEAQIQGMKYKADSYITKPFNQNYLEENIKSLLANRSMLKEYYSSEVSSELKTKVIGKLDKKFINEFDALVKNNIENEDFSTEDICKHLGLSRVQLYRKIKALLNTTINEYILMCAYKKQNIFYSTKNLLFQKLLIRLDFRLQLIFQLYSNQNLK